MNSDKEFSPLIITDFHENSEHSESSSFADVEKNCENPETNERIDENSTEAPTTMPVTSEEESKPPSDVLDNPPVVVDVASTSREPQPPDPAMEASPQNSNSLGVRGLGSSRFPSLVSESFYHCKKQLVNRLSQSCSFFVGVYMYAYFTFFLRYFLVCFALWFCDICNLFYLTYRGAMVAF